MGRHECGLAIMHLGVEEWSGENRKKKKSKTVRGGMRWDGICMGYGFWGCTTKDTKKKKKKRKVSKMNRPMCACLQGNRNNKKGLFDPY